ncbi:MAG: ABC transporter permease [Propionibacteriaceae bacterium]|jgi:peptide/nickel transport system permease protein|nr:ABC transporter permease [Propionibacteriaceae bacterium]
MARYIVRRVLNYVVLLFIACSFAYLLAASFLNPYSVYFGRQPPVDPAVIENVMRECNLSAEVSVWNRYLTWLTNIFTHWDWGCSPLRVSVNSDIGIRMWVSLRLVLIGTLGGIVVGVLVGAWTATRQYRIPDRVYTLLSLLVICTPSFVLGIVLQILATKVNDALGTRIFEFVGEKGTVGDYPFAELVDRMQHLLLPTLVLILLTSASLSRIQRNLMLDSLGADYVRTARAKGLPKSKAVMKHALRTALIPTGTYVAFTVATMFVGAIYTERVFSFPGMGQYSVDAILAMNVNGIAATTAFAGVCVVCGAILSDIVVAILDPRVRLGR